MSKVAPTIPEANMSSVKAAPGRGRSRQVSNVALARQASEERRTVITRCLFLRCSSTAQSTTLQHSTFLLEEQRLVPPSTDDTSPETASFQESPAPSASTSRALSPQPSSSTSPLSFACGSELPPTPYPAHSGSCESLPPAQTLEDQVHEAYAMENIHLAKKLLLRLKGVEVTSDDDPRIDAVRDEDFDFLFLPFGQLEDPDAERRIAVLQESARKLREEEARRAQWRAQGRIWEDAKKCYRDGVRRRQKQKQAAKRRAEKEQKDGAQERMRQKQRRDGVALGLGSTSCPSSYTPHTAHMTSPPNHLLYLYASQSPPCTSPPAMISASSSRPASPSFDGSRSVPFHDVLASMRGPLFPPVPDPFPERTERQFELWASLLQDTEWEGDLPNCVIAPAGDTQNALALSSLEQARKSSQPPLIRITPSSCASPSAAFPKSASASISPSSSRASSWFSFRSISTNITTPSSSSLSLRKWLSSSPPAALPKSRPRCRRRPRVERVSCQLSEHPLFSDDCGSAKASGQPTSRGCKTRSAAAIVVKRVSQIMGLARSFQNAYMAAALFAVATSADMYEDRDVYMGVGVSRSGVGGGVYILPTTRIKRRSPSRLRPAGCRVHPTDVTIFLSSDTPYSKSDELDHGDPLTHIPLRPRSRPPPTTPRTKLPNPLPYPIVFKPHPPVTRSPVRLIKQQAELMAASDDGMADSPGTLSWTYGCHSRSQSMPSIPSVYVPEPAVTWRMRAVSNPVHLRLRALQNVVWAKGVMWEGRGGTEWALGSGKEKVISIAYDGIGRSMLGRSFSAAVGR
ncbi:hypothetical protein AX16_000280 [Volvariella volvacea WC 439]|nr:hypothetical protein AX16_000280 [Volvariella volvacea WC 439]